MPDPNIARTTLPIPDAARTGLITYDAKDPDTKFPPIAQLRPPKGAPNILVILIDDVGFGASSAFGGPCHTPNAEFLASNGLKYNRFHTTVFVRHSLAVISVGDRLTVNRPARPPRRRPPASRANTHRDKPRPSRHPDTQRRPRR